MISMKRSRYLLLFFCIFCGLFIGTYALASDTIEGIYFWSSLSAEDTIKWHVIYSEPAFEDFEFKFENDSDILLTIKQDLADVNFLQMPPRNYTQYFELKYGNETEPFYTQDPLYTFLMPVDITYENTTTVNPCDKHWLYYFYDDVIYAPDEYSGINITKQNNIAIYTAWMLYPEYDYKLDLVGKINRNTGIMQSLNMRLSVNSTNLTITDMTIENIAQPEEPSQDTNFVAFNWVYMLLSLLILHLAFKRPKK